jgi:predicted adenylyl cyclase CyaB
VRELELKAVVQDPAALAARLAQAGAALTFRGAMRDRRYDRPDRGLLARDLVLRVRSFEPGDCGEARSELTWKGATRQTGGYKEREEIQFDVPDAAAAGEMLARLGFEVSETIDRCVEIREVEGATVRIEWYPRMDVLVEVEGTPANIERAVAATGIARGEFTTDRLLDFAARYRQRTGREPALGLGGLGPEEAPAWPQWAVRR